VRLLELFPGLLTWSAIIGPLFLAAIATWVAIYLIIALDVIWLVRSIVLVRVVRSTFRLLQEEEKTDWMSRLIELPREDWTDADGTTFDPREIYQAALIPTYTEKLEVLQATLSAWAAADYPAERKIVAIITRTTDTDGIANVQRLREEFEGRFHRFYHILDPLLPGIVVGKSAAMAYGGAELYRHLQQEGFDARHVIVTDLDADFRVHPQYLAYVSYEYCKDRDRDYRLYQPIPMFHNNIWRVPATVHVLASAATQWQMFLHARPSRLITFSSYSMSMHLIHDVGYWDPHVIQEDSRFYWRCFFRYGARLKVKGVFLPIYGDCPRSKSYARTHASQYSQIRRWAWGVSDVPFVFLNVLLHPEIPLRLRIQKFGLLVFNHFLWVSMPFLLLFGASLPGYFVFLSDAVGLHFPAPYDFHLVANANLLILLSSGILTLTLLNVSVLLAIEAKLAPPRPSEWAWWKRAKSYVEMFFYPVYALFFSVIPALESQTRLMFGFYLEYRVTEKE
jgi:hypothetical protein